MKTRRKKKTSRPPSTKPGFHLERVEVPTFPLVEIRDLGDILAREDLEDLVAGAFVKLSPIVKSSERESFDGPGLAQVIRDAGALAVTVAPRIVSDVKTPKMTADRRNPRELVKEWFDAQHAAPHVIADAHARVLDAMEGEGM